MKELDFNFGLNMSDSEDILQQIENTVKQLNEVKEEEVQAPPQFIKTLTLSPGRTGQEVKLTDADGNVTVTNATPVVYSNETGKVNIQINGSIIKNPA